MQPSELSDSPPCKRPLLIHPTNMRPDVDCDKYSCRIPEFKLSPQQFPLTTQSHILPTERTFGRSNIDEKDEYHSSKSFEPISKYGSLKQFMQRGDLKNRDQIFSSLNRRSEAFKNINHVSKLCSARW